MQACPKCRYTRKASDKNPDWQCPACGIAYAKYESASSEAATVSRAVPAQTEETSGWGFGTVLKGIAVAGGVFVAYLGYRSSNTQYIAAGAAVAVAALLWNVIQSGNNDWSSGWWGSSDSGTSDGDGGGGDSGGGD